MNNINNDDQHKNNDSNEGKENKENMKDAQKDGFIVGIDLGTKSSSVSLMDTGEGLCYPTIITDN